MSSSNGTYASLSNSDLTDLATLPTAIIRSLLSPIVLPRADPRANFHNWAKTFDCVPAIGEFTSPCLSVVTGGGTLMSVFWSSFQRLIVFTPSTTTELVLIVTLAYREGKQLRAVGAGHSPSDLGCVASRPAGKSVGEGKDGLGWSSWWWGKTKAMGEQGEETIAWDEEGGWMVRMDLMNQVYKVSLPHAAKGDESYP
jgi:hypothetical protein